MANFYDNGVKRLVLHNTSAIMQRLKHEIDCAAYPEIAHSVRARVDALHDDVLFAVNDDKPDEIKRAVAGRGPQDEW